MTPRTTRATPNPSPVTDPALIQRVLGVGLLAGLAAGLAIAALQHVTTTPLILAAEVFETAQHAAHGETEAAPWSGLARTGVTSVAAVSVCAGYALLLLAGMLAAGEKIDARSAVLWGACAFAAAGLATGLGLAPQLPGAAESDLHGRQIWWFATAAATAAGLFALLRLDGLAPRLFGLAAIVLPHLFTPLPAAPESTAPAELAARFAAASLGVQAVSWVLAGAFAGGLWALFEQREKKDAA